LGPLPIYCYSEPLQSIAESHLLGYKSGQRNGDVSSSTINYQFYLLIIYFTGQSLAASKDKSREFALQLLQRKQQFMLNGACAMYHSAVAFMKGLDFKEEGLGVEKLPSWIEIKSRSGLHVDLSIVVSSAMFSLCVYCICFHPSLLHRSPPTNT